MINTNSGGGDEAVKERVVQHQPYGRHDIKGNDDNACNRISEALWEGGTDGGGRGEGGDNSAAPRDDSDNAARRQR